MASTWFERRMELRALSPFPAGTDSNLKKNMAMVNKLKSNLVLHAVYHPATLTDITNIRKLCDELVRLKCDKFLGEFGASLFDGLLALPITNSTRVGEYASIIEVRFHPNTFVLN